MRRLFRSIITDYARAACGLKYKMDYTRIKETNITMSLPPRPEYKEKLVFMLQGFVYVYICVCYFFLCSDILKTLVWCFVQVA
jgi:hypothetical protein